MIKKMNIYVLFLLFLLLLPAGVFGEGEEALPPETDDSGFDFGMGFALAVVMFGDETYQRLSLTPDFSIGKFGLAFDITVHFQIEDSKIKFRREDWVPDDVTFLNVLSLYLGKFRYIRYGEKGDDIYMKFGSIDDAVLGSGFIMGYYSNTLFLPERRIFGLNFDLDGNLFNFPYIGIETFVSDVGYWDVMGYRLYTRPFNALDFYMVKNMQIGTTWAVDIDPYRYADAAVKTAHQGLGINTGDANVFFWGIDIIMPLVITDWFTMNLYNDWVTHKFDSYGAMVGLGGRIAKYIIYNTQLRFIGDNFIPVYFNATYDIERSLRYALLEEGTDSYIGWLATLGAAFFSDALLFYITVDGPFGRIDSNDDNPLNFPHLRAFLGLSNALISFFSFDITYDKSFIRKFKEMFRPEGAILKARVNYHVGNAVISFFYLLKYKDNDWSDPEITSGIEAGFQF